MSEANCAVRFVTEPTFFSPMQNRLRLKIAPTRGMDLGVWERFLTATRRTMKVPPAVCPTFATRNKVSKHPRSEVLRRDEIGLRCGSVIHGGFRGCESLCVFKAE